LSLSVTAARRDDPDLVDLTETNPTVVGLSYPPSLLTALAEPKATIYRPDALGLPEARAAIAEALGDPIAPDRMVLASSTSEAYGWLFKLLCDPGDEVLVPVPSYPLFELLAGLEAVRPRPYRLNPHTGWAIDRESVSEAVSNRTRAMLLVSPHNPTGALVRDDDRAWLVRLARERQFAIVADEVFWDYRLRPVAGATSFRGENGALTFTLGGLSKSVGLPQLKLAWIVVNGPEYLCRDALVRLEIIADTYLSVSTPVQVAAEELLAAGALVRDQIRERTARNLATLRDAVRQYPAVTVLEPEGGWSAAIRVPALESDDVTVLRALRDGRVLVHPGYFFDFEEAGIFVLSLLPRPDRFEEGLRRLLPLLSEVARG
jgi:aspartate/methionine/tyrosine aminotransferase